MTKELQIPIIGEQSETEQIKARLIVLERAHNHLGNAIKMALEQSGKNAIAIQILVDKGVITNDEIKEKFESIANQCKESAEGSSIQPQGTGTDEGGG